MDDHFEQARSPRVGRRAIIGIVVLVALLGLAGVLGFSAVRGAVASDEVASADDGELDRLTRLYDSLTANAVDAPDGAALVDAAIEAMLDEIDDPYAEYFRADDFTAFNESLDGTFSGVGLMLTDTPDGPVIVSVLEGTPAEAAGIDEGERIVSVDGESVRDDPLEEIVARVKGDAGTAVTLGLEDEDGDVRDLEIVRAEFDIPVVTTERLDDVGYVRLLQFTDGSGQAVRAVVDAMVADGVRGVVLDLRNNPGGLLDEAVGVASLFIEDGEIVTVEERGGRREVSDAVGDAFERVPLSVLIDEGSASASEIVAGAIQDADRGAIVGEQSFGKGTVQTITRLPDGAGAKFTTARYFTPSGDSIEGVGVAPEIAVEGAEDVEGPADDPQVEAAIDALTAGG